MIMLYKYLRNRLLEESTWVGFGVAIASASLLPTPYSYAAIACGVIAMLVPQKAKKGDGDL